VKHEDRTRANAMKFNKHIFPWVITKPQNFLRLFYLLTEEVAEIIRHVKFFMSVA